MATAVSQSPQGSVQQKTDGQGNSTSQTAPARSPGREFLRGATFSEGADYLAPREGPPLKQEQGVKSGGGGPVQMKTVVKPEADGKVADKTPTEQKPTSYDVKGAEAEEGKTSYVNATGRGYGDRKSDTLQAFDAEGIGAPPVPVADVTALATDPYGRVFVATKETLLRWDGAGVTVVLALGRLSAPAAIAVEASGVVWIADRKGDRVERWVPGTPAPVVVRESKGAGVAALAVAGGRVIAAEAKTGRVVILAGPGSDAGFGSVTFRRPVALAVDAAGRISVLDEKAETVTRLTPSGEVSDTLPLGASGVSRPLALSVTPDGALRILDGSTGAVAVAP